MDGEPAANLFFRSLFKVKLSLDAATMALSLEQIRRTADRVAASHGLEVVEVEYLGVGRRRVLRVFIEKNREERARLAAEGEGRVTQDERSAEGPDIQTQPAALDRLAWVTHADCELFSRDFGAVLEVEDLAPESEYTLEVSSPGLDRKLTGRTDYERFQGDLVKVQTFAPVAGNRHWQGRLTEVKASGIALDSAAVKQAGRKKTTAAGDRGAPAIEIAFANIEKANLIPEF